MRSDALGLFWEDTPAVKAAKAEKVKCVPPDRTWERQDYLPGLAEAQRFDVDLFTDEELMEAQRTALITGKPHYFVYDIECYPNYFLIAFRSLVNNKVLYFELDDTLGRSFNERKLQWVLENFCHVGFNSINYDAPITAIAIAGCTTEQMWHATTKIIVEQERGADVLKYFKAKKLEFNHIDLIEVAPLRASLKIYGGRLHMKRMQDLPFVPGTYLTDDQIDIVRWYCLNDLDGTAELYNELREQLDLRNTLSLEYRTDLRSKSDAQIAEAIIGKEVQILNGERPQRPTIEIGTAYRYRTPDFLRFQTPLMNWVLSTVQNAWFIVDESGSVAMPPQIKELKISIANGVYQMGIGGLHSTEQSVAHFATDDILIEDDDVVSYYPFIIINQGLYPKHLGPNFLKVYKTIVQRRIDAKEAGNKVVADSLKITINGSFGKLGSKYSILYAPDLLIQTTVTGQLALLMLIEWFELAGITVVSANTDGIVTKYHKRLQGTKNAIIAYWENVTGFKTERTSYSAVYSRDVNNYIAVYTNRIIKGTKTTYAKFKGAYSKAGLQKNPTNYICVLAVQDYLVHRTPIDTTIRKHTDIRDFLSVRTVKGGAVKVWSNGETEYLGKSIRWYYAEGIEGEIVYALSGKKVPRSDGARPLMDLPAQFPADINYDWYIAEANKILGEIGYE